jgi:hypothetical protein
MAPYDLSFIINELGEDREQYFNAVAPPIVQTSNFAFNSIADLRKAFEDEMSGYLYSRGLIPPSTSLRKKAGRAGRSGRLPAVCQRCRRHFCGGAGPCKRRRSYCIGAQPLHLGAAPVR